VKAFKYPTTFTAADKKTLPVEMYATIDDPGANQYAHFVAVKAEAAEGNPEYGTHVATYRLEKIELLRVERSVRVVEVK
jgi:hypothetical protein